MYPYPTERQGVCGSQEIHVSAATWRVRLPNETLAGNNLLLFVDANSSVTISSVADNLSTSGWEQVMSPLAAGQSGHIWRLPNTQAGIREVTVTLGASDSFMQFSLWEVAHLSNEPISRAMDGTAGTATGQTGLTITGGSTTTLTDRCAIFQFIFDRTQTDQTQFWPGFAFRLLATNSIDGFAVQMQVQGTRGAITPTMGVSVVANYNSMSFALKNDPSKGSAALANGKTRYVQHQCPRTWASKPLPFPSSGNCIFVSTGWGDNARVISRITDNEGNTYFQNPKGRQSDATQGCDQWLAANARTNQGLVVNVELSGGSLDHGMLLLYDVVGAKSSPLGQTMGTTGTQGAPGGDLTTGSITRTETDSIVIYSGVIFSHTAINLANGAGKWYADMMTENVSDGSDISLDEADLWGHSYGTDLSSESPVWQIQDGGLNNGVNGWCILGAEILVSPQAIPVESPVGPGLVIGSPYSFIGEGAIGAQDFVPGQNQENGGGLVIGGRYSFIGDAMIGAPEFVPGQSQDNGGGLVIGAGSSFIGESLVGAPEFVPAAIVGPGFVIGSELSFVGEGAIGAPDTAGGNSISVPAATVTYVARVPQLKSQVQVPARAHTYTAQVPQVRTKVQPAQVTHTYVGRVPALPTRVAVPARTHTYTAQTPQLRTKVQPAQATHTYTAQTPQARVKVQPGQAVHTYTARVPQVRMPVAPAAATHTYLGRVPTLPVSNSVAPAPATHTYVGRAPQALVKVQPGQATHSYAGQTPKASSKVQPAQATHAYTARAPRASVHVGPAPATHTYVGRAPQAKTRVQPGPATHTVLGRIPATAAGNIVFVPAIAHLYAGMAPASIVAVVPVYGSPVRPMIGGDGSRPAQAGDGGRFVQRDTGRRRN